MYRPESVVFSRQVLLKTDKGLRLDGRAHAEVDARTCSVMDASACALEDIQSGPSALLAVGAVFCSHGCRGYQTLEDLLA